MTRQFGLVSSITMIVVAVAARDVYGCSCMSNGPPRQAYFQVDAVFIGTVESIAVRKTTFDAIPDGLFDRRVVHVAVDRISRGVRGPTVDLWTGMGRGDCGFDFKVGSRYVIYASRRADGALSTGICSRTRLVSEAADDLAYLASVPASATGARLSGTIKHTEHDYAAGKPSSTAVPSPRRYHVVTPFRPSRSAAAPDRSRAPAVPASGRQARARTPWDRAARSTP